jgi:hypothetical protein
MTCCSVRFLMDRSVETGNCVFRSSLRVPAQFLHGFIDISKRPAVLTPMPSLSIASHTFLVVSSTLIHLRLHFHRQTAPVTGTSHLHLSSCSLLPYPQNLQLPKIFHLTQTLQRTTVRSQQRHGDNIEWFQQEGALTRPTQVLVSRANFGQIHSLTWYTVERVQSLLPSSLGRRRNNLPYTKAYSHIPLPSSELR